MAGYARVSESTKGPVPVFPSPAGHYDQANEAQFRLAVERFLQEASAYAGSSTGIAAHGSTHAPAGSDPIPGLFTGSGTAGKLAKFTDTAVVGNSIITEASSTLYVGSDPGGSETVRIGGTLRLTSPAAPNKGLIIQPASGSNLFGVHVQSGEAWVTFGGTSGNLLLVGHNQVELCTGITSPTTHWFVSSAGDFKPNAGGRKLGGNSNRIVEIHGTTYLVYSELRTPTNNLRLASNHYVNIILDRDVSGTNEYFDIATVTNPNPWVETQILVMAADNGLRWGTVAGGMGAYVASSDDLFSLPIDNNTWLTWRNAANSADLNVLKAGSDDNTYLNTKSSGQIYFQVNGTTELTLNNAGMTLADLNSFTIQSGYLYIDDSYDIRSETSGNNNIQLRHLYASGDYATAIRQTGRAVHVFIDSDNNESDAEFYVGHNSGVRGSATECFKWVEGSGLSWGGGGPIASSGDVGGIGSLTDDYVPFYDSAAGVLLDSAITYTGAVVQINSVHFTVSGGDLAVAQTSATAQILLRSDAGQYGFLWWQSSSTSRWNLFKNTDTESGSDAGSSLVLAAYTDAGAYKVEVWSARRSDGRFYVAQSLGMGGPILMDAYSTGRVGRAVLDRSHHFNDGASVKGIPGSLVEPAINRLRGCDNGPATLSYTNVSNGSNLWDGGYDDPATIAASTTGTIEVNFDNFPGWTADAASGFVYGNGIISIHFYTEVPATCEFPSGNVKIEIYRLSGGADSWYTVYDNTIDHSPFHVSTDGAGNYCKKVKITVDNSSGTAAVWITEINWWATRGGVATGTEDQLGELQTKWKAVQYLALPELSFRTTGWVDWFNIKRSNTTVTLTSGTLNLTNGYVQHVTSSDTYIQASNVSGDTYDRFAITTGGKLEWGPGNAGRDASMYYTGGQMRIQPNGGRVGFEANNTVGSMSLRTTSDTIYSQWYEAGKVIIDSRQGDSIELQPNQVLGLTLDANDPPNVVAGKLAAVSTSGTTGFLYVPTCAGAPTGTPTSFTGKVALIYDTTNNDLYVYNGAWKKVALA